jgi:hypothetical protein
MTSRAAAVAAGSRLLARIGRVGPPERLPESHEMRTNMTQPKPYTEEELRSASEMLRSFLFGSLRNPRDVLRLRRFLEAALAGTELPEHDHAPDL